MSTKEQNIWVKLRAEAIKHFQDTRNEGKFINGFPIAKARELAEVELASGLKNNNLPITLQELLVNTDEQNYQTVHERALAGLKLTLHG